MKLNVGKLINELSRSGEKRLNMANRARSAQQATEQTIAAYVMFDIEDALTKAREKSHADNQNRDH